MLRSWIRTRFGVLVVLEIAAFLAAPLIAHRILGRDLPHLAMQHTLLFASFEGAALLSMGLYSRRQRAALAGQILRAFAATFAAFIGIGFISYVVPALFVDRAALALAACIALGAVVVFRTLSEFVGDDEMFCRRVLVFGCGKRAFGISNLRRRSDRRGFRILGYIAAEGDQPAVPADAVIAPHGSLLELARESRVDEIVVAMDDRRLAFPVRELLDCRLAGFDVTDVLDFLERETGKVRLDALNPAWLIFSEGFRRGPIQRTVDRWFDLLASLTLLALAWPVMLLAILAIKLEDGWRAPVLYGQTRVGFEGKHFRVLKFRSMRVDAEKPGKAVWAAAVDSRVTRVGAFIRKVRIDELPQLLNILLGDMRFVGPRPERPEFVGRLEQQIPYYAERHTVKPGLTGWAQLCYPYGSSEQDALEKLQYDLYYVKNSSLLFDFVILLQTVEVVLWSRGAR